MPEGIVAGGAALWDLIAGAGAAATSGGVGTAIAQGAAGAAVGAGLSALTAPKIPGVKSPVAMPDQSAIDTARRRSVLQQRQRAGRSSTILSQGDGGTLG